MVDGLAVDRLRVAVPPSHVAGIRTELLFPMVRCVRQLGAALGTQFFLFVRVPPADGFDGIQRVPGQSSDAFVAEALLTAMWRDMKRPRPERTPSKSRNGSVRPRPTSLAVLCSPCMSERLVSRSSTTPSGWRWCKRPRPTTMGG